MSVLDIKTSSVDYKIYVEDNALSRMGDYVKTKVAIVVDRLVYSKWSSYIRETLDSTHIKYTIILVDGGEINKNINNVLYMYGEFHKAGITKSDYIACIGGGVVGDMTAFAAATYLRGVDMIQVPTTLLSMVDSSIGGKSAIDMEFGKNLVGVIKAPNLVLIDKRFLSTLDRRQVATGMAEIIKSGLIHDGAILDELEKDSYDVESLILRSLRVKGDIVMRDEFETGERMLLNLGHTVAHAIEALGAYTKYTHGEAVSIGTYYALKISEAVKGLSPDVTCRIVRIFDKVGLPYDNEYSTDDLIKYIATDKKMRDNIINFILVEDVERVVIEKLTLDKLKCLLDSVR